MKKLLLIGMLLLSGLAQATLTPEENAFISALQNADASKLSAAIQSLSSSFKINNNWTRKVNQGEKDIETTVTNFELIIETKKDDSDKIAALEVLINAGYKVTIEDLQLCFAQEHKAILIALTKLVAVAKDENLVREILETDSLELSVKKKLFANLKEANKELLQQSYVLEALLRLSTDDNKNDEVDAWIHTLVNEGANTESVKDSISQKIEKDGKEINNPRAKLLVKDSEQAAASLTSGAAVPVLCVSAGLVVSLIIWKKYGKKIKAFFAGEDDEDDIKVVKKA